jgi:methyl-accepting chemotaxis protein
VAPHRFRLPLKLAFLLGLSAVAMIAIAALSASTLRQRMLIDRTDKLRAVVHSAIGTAQTLEARVTSGELTRPQALEQMRHVVHTIRFDGGTGYIVGQTQDGLTAMHGTNPALEGKPLPTDVATGRSISDLTHDALGSGEETVFSYMFPKPGETQPRRKVVASRALCAMAT